MRIIGGVHRGRRLTVPNADDVRPTADRVRESVFNILAHGIDWPGFENASVIDLFAGTGAFGLECLSRGAAHATFIDISPDSLKTLQRNAAALGLIRSALLLKLDATRLPPPPRRAKAPCAVAFLDAPYGTGQTLPAVTGLAARGWVDSASLVVVEIGAQEIFAPPPAYTTIEDRTYGAARILFLKCR